MTKVTSAIRKWILVIIFIVVIVYLLIYVLNVSDNTKNKLLNTALESTLYIKDENILVLNGGSDELAALRREIGKGIYSTCVFYSEGQYGIIDVGMLRIAIEGFEFDYCGVDHVGLWNEIPEGNRVEAGENSGYGSLGSVSYFITQKNYIVRLQINDLHFVLDNSVFQYEDSEVNVLDRPKLIVIGKNGSVKNITDLPIELSPQGACDALNVIGAPKNAGQDQNDSNELKESEE